MFGEVRTNMVMSIEEVVSVAADNNFALFLGGAKCRLPLILFGNSAV